MLSEHISGDAFSGAARRSSPVMLWPPPVVMLMTASQACLMRGRNCMNTAGSGVGRPSLASRAWRWRMAAPASAASIACFATSSGVSGRCGLMVGVWIDPVTAQVMMTLPERANIPSPPPPFEGPWLWYLYRAVGADEIPHLRIDRLAPAPPVEHAVMADLGLDVTLLPARFQPGEQGVRGRGLADRANVVVLAFDGQERGARDRLRLHLARARHELPERQGVILENALHRLQVEIGRQIHHRHVFVVEFLGRERAFAVAFDQVAEQIDMRGDVAVEIHGHESGQLDESGIDPAEGAGIARRHRGDDMALKPGERARGGQPVDGRGIDAGVA